MFITGVERRRRLRQQYQREQLIQLWRITVLLGLATGLGLLLLRLGWTLRGPSQVRIEGNLNLSAETIFQAAGLRFPQLLLDQALSVDRELCRGTRQEQVSTFSDVTPLISLGRR